MQLRTRIFLQHYRREEWRECPLCGAPVRWVETDYRKYTPCDLAPVLYLDGGNMWLVKNREIIKTCTMYKPGMPHETIKYGLRPHVFTCPAIERRF